jgi:hypothetical protein
LIGLNRNCIQNAKKLVTQWIDSFQSDRLSISFSNGKTGAKRQAIHPWHNMFDLAIKVNIRFALIKIIV